MSAEFNERELQEFDHVVSLGSSRDQMERIESRLQLPKLIKQHGRPKCDAMWAEIKRRDYLKNPAARQVYASDINEPGSPKD